jgi:hypothetical protein
MVLILWPESIQSLSEAAQNMAQSAKTAANDGSPTQRSADSADGDAQRLSLTT